MFFLCICVLVGGSVHGWRFCSRDVSVMPGFLRLLTVAFAAFHGAADVLKFPCVPLFLSYKDNKGGYMLFKLCGTSF